MHDIKVNDILGNKKCLYCLYSRIVLSEILERKMTTANNFPGFLLILKNSHTDKIK